MFINIRSINRHLAKVVLFTAMLMAIVGAFSIQQAHADEFSGYQGTVNGNIPAVTRIWNNNKLFWCNAHLVVKGKCSVTQISPDDDYAITYTPADSTMKNCPTGGWGVTNRNTGRTIILIPSKQHLSMQAYCSGEYNARFVTDANAPSGYAVVMIYNGSVVEKIRNIDML